jgi:hypothetical protein
MNTRESRVRGALAARTVSEATVHKLVFVVIVCCLAGACGDEDRRVPAQVGAPTSTAANTSAPVVAAPPVDHEGVPNHGAAAPCEPVTGDARAMRQRLRAIERGRELVPPEAASLLEGCAAPRRDIARALEKAGRTIARARAHDNAAAAAYFRRALEIDPSYVAVRVLLAGARNQLGDIDGAFYQLDQIKGAGNEGARALARVYAERSLSSLRLLPRFWTWAGNPVPEMVAMLPGATESSLSPAGGSLVFSPPITIPPDRIYARAPISGGHYRALMTAVNSVTEQRVTHPGGLSRDLLVGPWVENLSSIGASLLTQPSAFRFGDGQVLLAIPFRVGEEGEQTPAFLLASGPEEGPYAILKVMLSSAECDEPVLFSSPDRRVLGFFSSCDGTDNPSAFGRCLINGESGRVVVRCGNGGTNQAVVGGNDDEEDYGDEAYPEDEEDYGADDAY